MFKKNDKQANERVIYQAKPNLIFGCKKAILGFILLAIVLGASGPIIQFIGEMQVYLISRVRLSLTSYAAIALFILILIIILYIIWQIVGWYAKEYILSDSRIMVKSGVLLTRKNYMPYSTIQDINSSQSIFSRIFNVGSISIYSAYDNTQMVIENISNPSEVEEIIFSKISEPRRFNPYPQEQNYINQDNYYRNRRNSREDFSNGNGGYNDNYKEDEYLDDDFVAITPIQQEEQYQRRKYDYYPEDLNYNAANQKPKYEYEPYEENLEKNINRAMNDFEAPNDNNQGAYYEEVRQNYSHDEDDYYHNNEREVYQNGTSKKDSKSNSKKIDESSESVIQRHFDKFKK